MDDTGLTDDMKLMRDRWNEEQRELNEGMAFWLEYGRRRDLEAAALKCKLEIQSRLSDTPSLDETADLRTALRVLDGLVK